MTALVVQAPEADFAEIAAALGVSIPAVNKRAAKEAWPFREQPGRGGKKRLFPLATLPAAVQNALLMHRAAVPPAPTLQTPSAPVTTGALPATKAAARPAGAFIPVSLASLANPNSEQLDSERARDRILDFIAAFQGSAPRAIEHLNAHHFAGTLPGPLAWAYDHAWDKKRKDSRLNLDTLNKWKKVKKTRGRSAPLKLLPDMGVKSWHALAVALVQRPQGSCKKWIHEQVMEQWNPAWGTDVPSYDVLCHFFREKFSQIDQLKGRYSGSQLRARMKYQHRDSSDLLPWDEVHADGWNTHFSAPHPVTGEYVTYEVWHAHDVATRFVPPFGVGLTENFEVIAKCVEHAYRAGGCMRFLQTDSTRIVKLSEKFKTNPATALADRAGFTIVHPVTVGNSQANGIAENFNTWLDKEARELATYQNPKRMDELSFKRGRKITAVIARAQAAGDTALAQAKRNELARVNKGLVLTSYEQTLAWLETKRQKWNHKPHRALPKVRDPDSGTLRHQTPAEALMQHIHAGWEACLLDDDVSDAALEQHLQDLFRTHMQVKVRRGTVSPYGGMRYEDDELPHWEGKDVVVAYDIMDWRRVWVKTLKGDPICVANFKHATGYRTQTAQEVADEKRTQARIKNHERAIARERASVPGMVVEGQQPMVIEQTIADFLPAAAARAAPERELTLLDFLPEKAAAAPESSYMDTVLMLYGTGEDKDKAGEEEGAPDKEAAAG